MADPGSMFGLIGAGGHARETMPWARAFIAANPDLHIDLDRIVFVDRAPGPAIGDHPVLGEDAFLALATTREFAVAIGDSVTRRAIAERLKGVGCRALTIVAPTATVEGRTRIAPGALIGPYALINPDVSVGHHLLANAYASLAHDCVVGDFVTLGPRACVNGTVTIGDGVEIGAGALIRQGLTLGEGCVIGMGAVVVEDVPPGVTVVGNPARMLPKVVR